MSALDQLATLLRGGTQVGATPMTPYTGMDEVLEKMALRAKANTRQAAPKERQMKAVQRFWDNPQVSSFVDGYLLSWGLCLPHRPQGPCIIEDRPRLQRVLDGVDGLNLRPMAFRRCYQGMVKSYFTYDGFSDAAPSIVRSNWRLLRDYLSDRNDLIREPQINPEWVDTAIGNRQLFGEEPCAPYIDALLQGDARTIEHLCEQLGINKASWFLRELVLAQVRGATQMGHERFKALIPPLLALLGRNLVLRDTGLILILDRYAQIPGQHLHQALRDASVNWWGNPWLKSNETRWGAVDPQARTMVADWLKLEFIETFFTKLAEDGLGDSRRMDFWKRYVKSMDHIEFALGATARSSRDPDFVMLRDKMKGLICHLDAAGTNNAFIMRLGKLVAVEFSGMGNALYCYKYEPDGTLPFDTSFALQLAIDTHNSLKQKRRCVLWMGHKDGIHGWEKWEHMFDATLNKHYGLKPSATSAPYSSASAPMVPYSTTPNIWNEAQPYSRSALENFAREQGLMLEDKTAQGGNLWVRTDNPHVAEVLTRWEFQYKPGKGWWK